MGNTGVPPHDYNDIDRKSLIPLTVRSSAVPWPVLSDAGSCKAPVAAGVAGGRGAGADGHAVESFLLPGTWLTTAGGLALTSQLLKEHEEYLSITNQVYLFCYMSGISLPLTFINTHLMRVWMERNCGEYVGPTIVWQMLCRNNNHLPGLWISGKLVRWGDGACQGRRISWRQRLMKGRGTQSCTTTEGQEMVGFTIFVVDGPFALAFWQLCEHSRVNPQEKHHSHHNLTPVHGAWTSLNSCQDAQHFNYSYFLRGHCCF